MSPASWPAAADLPQVGATDIVQLTVDACKAEPELDAIRFEDGISITRADFLGAVDRFASWLDSRIASGDRVGLMMQNRIEFMVAWIAVVAKGGTVVSINHDAGEHDTLHTLTDSAARVIVVDGKTSARVEALRSRLPDLEHVVSVDSAEPAGLAAYVDPDAPGLEVTRATATQITNIYYTSGTTGPPKGCLIGQDYWRQFIRLIGGLFDLTSEDKILGCLQFFYGDAPWQFLLSLHLGTTYVVMRRFSVTRFWEVARENEVTMVFGLASIPNLLLTAPADPRRDRDHRVRFGLQVGIARDRHVEMHERWGFPWVEAYGLTETGMVTGMPPADAERMAASGSIGIPVPEAEVRLVDDEGNQVPAGEAGEIWVKTPGMFKGYLNRPDADAETLVDGWMRTGDLGRVDGDGYYYFLGRRKDIIRRNGENVAAAEVEQVIRSHPKVLEVAVLPAPDELRGEEVAAFVSLVEGEDPTSVPPAELIEYCSGQLATYKLPRYITYRDGFPLTPSMRVRKSDLIASIDDPTADAWDREASDVAAATGAPSR